MAGVQALVSQWCGRTPDAPAVVVAGTGKRLTYEELWAASGALAGGLTARGVRPGDVVATALGRSADLIVALLGIVRAGGTYLALDAQAPPDRIDEMLADASVHCVLKSVGHDAGPAVAPTVEVSNDDPCYLVYTSGSTGRPKGVLVPHRGVIRLVRRPVFCALRPGDRVANVANPAFDASTFEIWATLAAGATIVVLPDIATHGLDRWVEAIRTERLTVMHLTTSVFNLLARERPAAFATLDTLLFGGEQADPALIRRVLSHGAPGRLVNLYGPTETTMLASYFDCTSASVPPGGRVPIGYPIQDTTLSIVDDGLAPVPDGEIGELCVGGPGVALGYLGQPELTAEKFVPEPGNPSSIWYRTGDLARRLPSGALELTGRWDRQVKLRGFRVELDEVEQAAVATGLVDTAIVEKTGEGPAASLVGFVLPEDADTAALTAHLADRLPGYMLPARWTTLAELPLAPTGKVDRAALVAGEEPADELTGLIDGVWRELLRVAAVRAGDNFIGLGGNSLLAVQAAARISERLAVEVEPADVLLADTFADLVGKLRSA